MIKNLFISKNLKSVNALLVWDDETLTWQWVLLKKGGN